MFLQSLHSLLSHELLGLGTCGDSFLCVVMNVFKESDSIPHLAIPLRSSTKASGSILAVPLMKNLNSFKNQDNPFFTL